MPVVECPFCAEEIDVWVDPGGGDHQEYIEDCSVCCRPIRFVTEREESDSEHVVYAFRE